MTPPTLGTIGYQGAVLAGVVRRLAEAGIGRVLDIRAVPLSRKPGFSKRALAAGLAEAGIGYTHLRALGTPADGRLAARRGDALALGRIYGAHLATAEAGAALAEAAGLARAEPCCLLCFERDPALCHRTIVADRLAAAGRVTIRHLRCD